MTTGPKAPSAPAPASTTPANASQVQPTNGPIPPGQGSNTGPKQPPAPQTPPRMMKLKIDGKEVELPESEVVAYAQQGRVASQRFQEAAAMRKQAEELLRYAKANPKEFFEKTGMNARQWAEEYLMGELQAEAMSPEQKKARENEEKLRKYEQDEKKRADKVRQEQLERDTNMHRERLDKMFTQALHESGLPRTAFTVKRMAELQLINIKNKYELAPSQLAKLVREDYMNEQKSLLSALDGDQLMDFLGQDMVKKLSKAQIAKLKAKSGATTSTTTSKVRTSQPNEEGLTYDQWKKRNRRPL